MCFIERVHRGHSKRWPQCVVGIVRIYQTRFWFCRRWRWESTIPQNRIRNWLNFRHYTFIRILPDSYRFLLRNAFSPWTPRQMGLEASRLHSEAGVCEGRDSAGPSSASVARLVCWMGGEGRSLKQPIWSLIVASPNTCVFRSLRWPQLYLFTFFS